MELQQELLMRESIGGSFLFLWSRKDGGAYEGDVRRQQTVTEAITESQSKTQEKIAKTKIRLFLISDKIFQLILYTNLNVTIEKQYGGRMVQWILNDVPLGRNIQNLRIKNDLTQSELVAKLQVKGINMSRSTLANIETGRRNIKARDLKAIKEVLNVEYDKFFENIELEKANISIDGS